MDGARALDVSEDGAVEVDLQRLLPGLVGNQGQFAGDAGVGLHDAKSVGDTRSREGENPTWNHTCTQLLIAHTHSHSSSSFNRPLPENVRVQSVSTRSTGFMKTTLQIHSCFTLGTPDTCHTHKYESVQGNGNNPALRYFFFYEMVVLFLQAAVFEQNARNVRLPPKIGLCRLVLLRGSDTRDLINCLREQRALGSIKSDCSSATRADGASCVARPVCCFCNGSR